MEVYEGFAAKASALLYGLSKSQACYEGNKRVALLLTIAFVRNNGARLNVQPNEMADQILWIAESDPADHDGVIATLAEWFTQRLPEEMQ